MRVLAKVGGFLATLLVSAAVAHGSVAPLGKAAASPSSLRAIRVWSKALDRVVRVVVYLPAGYDPSARGYPTLYLLHGVPGTPDSLLGLGLRPTLDREIASGALPPMIVVLPTGGLTPDHDSEWEDSAVDPSQRWGTFVDRDLVQDIDGRYHTLASRVHRAIAGISMGGFGAANIGLRKRDEFGTISIWSGYFEANTPSVEGPTGSTAWLYASPLHYVPTLRPSLTRLPVHLSFYSGRQDSFFGENVRFDALLTRLGVPHRFLAVAGGHDWAVWRAHLASELAWIGANIA